MSLLGKFGRRGPFAEVIPPASLTSLMVPQIPPSQSLRQDKHPRAKAGAWICFRSAIMWIDGEVDCRGQTPQYITSCEKGKCSLPVTDVRGRVDCARRVLGTGARLQSSIFMCPRSPISITSSCQMYAPEVIIQFVSISLVFGVQ